MRKEFFNSANKGLDMYMINCGYEDCIVNFKSNHNIRDFYLIHYITKGSGFYETQNQKFELNTGDIFISYPGHPTYYYSPNPNDPWSFCWIGFSGVKAKDYLSLTGDLEYVKRSVSRQFYHNVMSCISYIEENGFNTSQLKLNSYVLNCLSTLEKNTFHNTQRANEHVERALMFIEYSYNDAITTKDVCSYLNLERTYFYRIFKKNTGISPEQYIMQYRIQKACELLQYTNYSISEIASYVGINDLYYFSRLFRKTMNTSPSEYRKSLSNHSTEAVSFSPSLNENIRNKPAGNFAY